MTNPTKGEDAYHRFLPSNIAIYFIFFLVQAPAFWGWLRSGFEYYFNLLASEKMIGNISTSSMFKKSPIIVQPVATTTPLSFPLFHFVSSMYHEIFVSMGWLAFGLSVLGMLFLWKTKGPTRIVSILYLLWILMTALPPGTFLPLELGRGRVAQEMSIFGVSIAPFGLIFLNRYLLKWRTMHSQRTTASGLSKEKTSIHLDLTFRMAGRQLLISGGLNSILKRRSWEKAAVWISNTLMILIFEYQIAYGLYVVWFMTPWNRAT